MVLREGFWADILAGRQAKLWTDLSSAHRLDYRPLREFVIGALGDPIAYRPVPTTLPTTYHAIHIRVFEELDALKAALPPSAQPLLVLVGHSLGSVILSDHVWDEQKGQGHGGTRSPERKRWRGW